MAKIKFGAVITDSRGHIGGITYKWSRFGNVAQRLVTPTRRYSNRTTTARSNFSTFSRRWWSTLTPTERTEWRTLAAANPRADVWGDEYPLTGHDLYIGINRILTTAGYAAVDTAPSTQTVTGLSAIAITSSAPDNMEVTFTPTPLPAGHLLYIFARANFSPGIEPDRSHKSFLLATAEEETSTLEIGTEFSTLLGDIIAGRQQAIFAALLNVTDGALSPLITATAIAT